MQSGTVQNSVLGSSQQQGNISNFLNSSSTNSGASKQNQGYLDRMQKQSMNMPNYETKDKYDSGNHLPEKCVTTKQQADSQGGKSLGDKLHRCEVCPAVFLQKHHLTQHLNTHSNERPHRCEQCSAAFGQKHSLNRHMRTHTGEKPFKCSYCEAVFALKHGLSQHLIIHTGEKPHKCTLCSSKFSRKFSLDRHFKVHLKPKK